MSLLTVLPGILSSMREGASGAMEKNGGKWKKGIQDSMTSANSSLVEYSSDLTAEFVTLLDEDLAYQPYIGDILQNALSITTAYYLRAAAVDTTISGVKVKDRLNKINPNRGGSFSSFLSTESLHDGLPNYLSLEAADAVAVKNGDGDDGDKKAAQLQGKKPTEIKGTGVGSRYAESIRSYDSMLVGKNIEVTITENKDSVTLPVNVRLSVLGAPSQEIVDILGLASQGNSQKERMYRFKRGQLSFFGDMLFCDDLIKQHTKTLMKEKSGFYAQTLERRRKNRLAAMASGEMSVAAASNIVIISETTALRLESVLGGKLDRQQVREDVFATTGTMVLFVVNTKWENVTMYTKSLANSSTVSLRNIKMLNKDGGDGILESLQKMLAGKGPI